MLKGIPRILPPALLKVLCEMGHSDRICIADANFPAESMGKDAIVIRMDGHGIPEILDAILTVFPLDTYVDQNVDATAIEGVAFHKNAFALVTRVPALPKGAANAATVDYDGFGLRVVYSYDINKKTDVVSIDLLCGAATLDEKLAAKITA